MGRFVPNPKAKILQLGVVEISVEITGVYMRVRKGKWLPVTYDELYELAKKRRKHGRG